MRKHRDYLLFVSFFPQLLAGPIVRAAELLPQLAHRVRATSAEIESGLAQFGVGAIKKLVIADQVAGHVNLIFAAPGQYRRADAAAGRGRIRRADLLRFFRLLGHGHRRRPHHGLPHRRELPDALQRGQHHGVLAPLAHFALVLVPGLPVPAFRVQLLPADAAGAVSRGPRGSRNLRRRDSRDVRGLRPLARSELDVRRLGLLPRRGAGRPPCMEGVAALQAAGAESRCSESVRWCVLAS